jgi:hypothetical protein
MPLHWKETADVASRLHSLRKKVRFVSDVHFVFKSARFEYLSFFNNYMARAEFAFCSRSLLSANQECLLIRQLLYRGFRARTTIAAFSEQPKLVFKAQRSSSSKRVPQLRNPSRPN